VADTITDLKFTSICFATSGKIWDSFLSGWLLGLGWLHWSGHGSWSNCGRSFSMDR